MKFILTAKIRPIAVFTIKIAKKNRNITVAAKVRKKAS